MCIRDSSKALYRQLGVSFNARKLNSEIEDTDKKIADRQLKGEEEAKKKAKEKKTTLNRQISDAKARQGILNGQHRAQDVPQSSRIKVTGTTKTVKPIGRVKTTKLTKATKK